MSKLWQILVPRKWNDGDEIPLDYHRQWDEQVRIISGGLTILKSVRGIWESPEGEIFEEGMVPVLVMCDDKKIEEIIEFTLDHYYDQKAVMYFLVSDHVFIKHRS